MCIGGGLTEVTFPPHLLGMHRAAPKQFRIPPPETLVPLYQCFPTVIMEPGFSPLSHSHAAWRVVTWKIWWARECSSPPHSGVQQLAFVWGTAGHHPARLYYVGFKFCCPERMILDTFRHTWPWTVWVPEQAACSAHYLIKLPFALILFLTPPLPPFQSHKNMFRASSIYNWGKLAVQE